MNRRLVIATRESRLALWQAHFVRDRLRELHPGLEVELLGMTTQGDRILDRALSEIGGKGLFTKELEVALADGRADLAVHSLKDVPMQLPEGFVLAAVMEREDPRDAWVSPRYDGPEALPAGAKVGTSSLRRAAMLRARFPHLEVLPLRGNLDTRLGKLDRGDYDAIVLAAAGLKRLGLAERIRALMPVADSLPSPGQGALGIEIREGRDDVAALLAPLDHADTRFATAAEREVSRALGGSCRVPLAAFATREADGRMRIDAMVATEDGSRIARTVQADAVADEAGALALGRAAVERLRADGAEALLGR